LILPWVRIYSSFWFQLAFDSTVT